MDADSHDAKTTFDNEQTKKSRAVRALTVAALLVLPLGLLSACGGDDEPETIAIDAEIEITTQPDSAADQDAAAQPDTTTDATRTTLR